MSSANALKPSEIKRVLKSCLAMRDSEIKRCALVFSHAALRVTELALLETKHVLTKRGELRTEIHLPARICKHLKPRTLWLTNKQGREIVQEWIAYRQSKKWGTVINSKDYCGLNPNSKFLYSNRGMPYSIQPKPRKLETGEIKIYHACDALEALFREVYRKCGFFDCSSHTGRKSLVTNAVIKGVPLEKMARILGHRSIETTIDYVVIDPERIKQMYMCDWL